MRPFGVHGHTVQRHPATRYQRSHLLKAVTHAAFRDDMLGSVGVIFQLFAKLRNKHP